MCQVFFIDDEADLRIAIEQTFELADIDAKFFCGCRIGFNSDAARRRSWRRGH